MLLPPKAGDLKVQTARRLPARGAGSIPCTIQPARSPCRRCVRCPPLPWEGRQGEWTLHRLLVWGGLKPLTEVDLRHTVRRKPLGSWAVFLHHQFITHNTSESGIDGIIQCTNSLLPQPPGALSMSCGIAALANKRGCEKHVTLMNSMIWFRINAHKQPLVGVNREQFTHIWAVKAPAAGAYEPPDTPTHYAQGRTELGRQSTLPIYDSYSCL